MEALDIFPVQASSFAGEVDLIYMGLMLMTGFFVTAIALFIFVFMIKFRRAKRLQTPPKTITKGGLEVAWFLIPLVGGLSFFAWGANLFLKMYAIPSGQSYEVLVTGKQWMWKFQHPAGQREINELHVPIGIPIKLIMVSQDVIHSFYVPAFRMKHDVLPMKYTQSWFEAIKEGSYHLFCAEYCGTAHSRMIGQVVALKPAAFEQWLSTVPSQGSPADLGHKLMQDLGCLSCHRPEATAIAPRLEGIYGKEVLLSGGSKVVADENYIRESILNPNAKVVANFKPLMPTYAGRVDEEELMAIVAYIKSLGENP